MTILFYDVCGISHVDYLKNGKTTNAHFGQLQQSCERKISAFAESSEESSSRFHELGSGLFPHPIYRSDLASRDYFLFPTMNKMARRKKIGCNDVANSETNGNRLEHSYFFEDIQKLEKIMQVKFFFS